MARSEHYLYRAKPSPWPKTVIALHAQVDWIDDVNSPQRQHLQLLQWNVAIVTKEPSGYVISRSACGATADGFWTGMAECLNRSRGATLICSCTRQAAAALQLWEGLENGEVTIAGNDHRQGPSGGRNVSGLPQGSGDNVVAEPKQVDEGMVRGMRHTVGKGRGNGRGSSRNGSERRPGIMIVQDPPVVMELRLEGSQYKLTWLDAANYSVDCATEYGDTPETARRLAEWFISAAATLKSLGDCGWQNTAGSQAMHLYRSSYLDASILSHTHPVASGLERDALFGGRCECFRIGRVAGNVHLFDIRSMYPYLCSVLSVPVRLCRTVERPTMDELRLLDPALFCIAEVAIETDEPNYPVRNGDAVVYPAGRFWTTICGVELAHAMQAGHVRGVRRIAIYESESAIKRYAEALYTLRRLYDSRCDMVQSAYIKRLMNSVVGKFAQTDRRWMDCPNGESAFEWGEWWGAGPEGDSVRWRSLAGYVQREEKGGWSHGAVPAITVCITSAGRARLRETMDAARRENVVYCDTDAIIVNDFGSELLTLAGWIRPGEWGYLQHVESADGCTIYGDKKYTIGKRSRYSGASTRPSEGRPGRLDGSSQSATHAAFGNSGRNGGCLNRSNQPWIGWALRQQMSPADWRESHPAGPVAGRYDRTRAPGGVVKPVELWEW